MAIRLGEAQLNHFVRQQAQGPVGVSLRRFAARHRDHVGALPFIQFRLSSGSSARLIVGSETPVLGNAQLDRAGNQVQAVEYKSSGVILDLKPEVRADTSELAISQQLSNFIQTTTGVNNSPTLIKRELSTTDLVKDGDVLVLGGLDEQKETAEKSGLFFLPSWLGSTSKSNARSEVLIVLEAVRI